MTKILAPARSGRLPVAIGPQGRLTRREELLSVTLGAWLVIGLFIDGWAHNHQRPETIFTPWHAILYSGFVACAAYSRSGCCGAAQPRGRRRDSLPPGQGLVLVGVAVFAVGAAGDVVWHSVFGIEVDIAALLSPTHLVMFTGAALLLTGPFRAAWADGSVQAPTLAELDRGPLLLAAPIAGGVADLHLRRLDPSPARPWALRAFAFTVPVVLWLRFFALHESPTAWDGSPNCGPARR